MLQVILNKKYKMEFIVSTLIGWYRSNHGIKIKSLMLFKLLKYCQKYMDSSKSDRIASVKIKDNKSKSGSTRILP